MVAFSLLNRLRFFFPDNFSMCQLDPPPKKKLLEPVLYVLLNSVGVLFSIHLWLSCVRVPLSIVNGQLDLAVMLMLVGPRPCASCYPVPPCAPLVLLAASFCWVFW